MKPVFVFKDFKKKDEKLIVQNELYCWIKQLIQQLQSRRVRNKYRLNKKELVFVFLNSSDMRRINFKYRKKNKSTDVLSFISEDPRSLGELLICTDVIRKQAREHGVSFKEELFLMIVHGVLHLLGYDHELSKKEEKLMFSIQTKIFERLGGL